MRNGNGGGPRALAIPAELAELFGGGRPKSREEEKVERLEAFASVVDTILNGCPGSKEDPSHAARDEALIEFVRHQAHWDMLPEPVANAVIKALAYNATHGHGELSDNLANIFDMKSKVLGIATIVAGVVLKIKDAPDTTGVARTDGRGQYL